MSIKNLVIVTSISFWICSFGFADEPFFSAGPPTRSDSIPREHVESEEDAYLEGYIQALVNANYYEFDVLVYVENGDVYLYNLPKNALIKNSIISFVSDIPM